MSEPKYPNKRGIPDRMIECYLRYRQGFINAMVGETWKQVDDVSLRFEVKLDDDARDLITFLDFVFDLYDDHGNLKEWAKNG